jgi:hypothetical protein
MRSFDRTTQPQWQSGRSGAALFRLVLTFGLLLAIAAAALAAWHFFGPFGRAASAVNAPESRSVRDSIDSPGGVNR